MGMKLTKLSTEFKFKLKLRCTSKLFIYLEAKEEAKVQDENPIPELEELDNLLEKYQYLGTSAQMPQSQEVPIQEYHGTSVSAPEGQHLGISEETSEEQISAPDGQNLGTSIPIPEVAVTEGQYLGISATPTPEDQVSAPEWEDLGNNQLPLDESETFEMDMQQVQVVKKLAWLTGFN